MAANMSSMLAVPLRLASARWPSAKRARSGASAAGSRGLAATSSASSAGGSSARYLGSTPSMGSLFRTPFSSEARASTWQRRTSERRAADGRPTAASSDSTLRMYSPSSISPASPRSEPPHLSRNDTVICTFCSTRPAMAGDVSSLRIRSSTAWLSPRWAIVALSSPLTAKDSPSQPNARISISRAGRASSCRRCRSTCEKSNFSLPPPL
mmetsp:Transcript_10098/g.26682  ORF Transcript_10098/g.26682 Transcript_10098/m.26682 type:complete len:210 (-) Transcript_10098:21-650(-)